MNCEYVAVVRVEELPNSKIGVAVHLKLSMNYSGSSAFAREMFPESIRL